MSHGCAPYKYTPSLGHALTNWNIPMKPSLSSLHSQLSSVTSYVTHIIFGNWKGLKSIGCVFDYVLIMNGESQLLSSSRSMSDTGTRPNMNPLTMVQQGMSLFVCMKNSMDKNVKKPWFSASQALFDSQKSSSCLMYLYKVPYLLLLPRSIVWHPHQSTLVMIR